MADLWEQMRMAVGLPAQAQPDAPLSPAAQAWMEGEGGLIGAAPPALPRAPDALWMLGEHVSARRSLAFTDSIGLRYGRDYAATAAHLLDRWSECPAGFRWTLDPSANEGCVTSERAEAVLAPCFSRTRYGLTKRAVVECSGSLEQAIIASLNEYMEMLGIENLIPEPAEALNGR